MHAKQSIRPTIWSVILQIRININIFKYQIISQIVNTIFPNNSLPKTLRYLHSHLPMDLNNILSYQQYYNILISSGLIERLALQICQNSKMNPCSLIQFLYVTPLYLKTLFINSFEKKIFFCLSQHFKGM